MSRIAVNIPEGTSGDFEIAHYTNETTDKQWQIYLQSKKESHSNYCVLTTTTCPQPIMQDSEGEYKEHQWLWNNATGDVFIGGLGIGLCNAVLISNPNITSITIIENSQDVIDLVWPHCLKDDRFNLIHANIETWIPPQDSQWDIMWFDTWCSDNPLSMQEYKDLMINKYSIHCSNIGFWGSLPPNLNG
jgi:spermidine synthase